MIIGLTLMFLGTILVGCGLVVSLFDDIYDEDDRLPEIEPLDDDLHDVQY